MVALNMVALLLSTALSLVALAVLFRPLEAAFPARPGQRMLRPGWATDLCFFLGQYLLFSALVLALLAPFGAWIGQVLPAGLRSAVAAQPRWLQALEVLALSDLCVYWGHRLQHRVRLPVALPRRPPQRRAPRLAGRAPRASAGLGLHAGPDQPAGLRAGLPAGHARGRDRLPRAVGHLHPQQRAPAAGAAARARGLARAAPLAPRPRARRRATTPTSRP